MRVSKVINAFIQRVKNGDEGNRTPDLLVANETLSRTELRPHRNEYSLPQTALMAKRNFKEQQINDFGSALN